MKLTLYTGNKCHQCQVVLDFLHSNNIDFTEINVDATKADAPIPLFIFPALFIDDKLEAYGVDIIDRLKK